MLQNAYLLAKIGADTAENEQNFAENSNVAKNWQLSYGSGDATLMEKGRPPAQVTAALAVAPAPGFPAAPVSTADP